MSWLYDKTTELLRMTDDAKRHRAFPFLRPFENIGPRVKMGPYSYINFTSNDYLGLSQHPRLIRQATVGTARYGTGLGSSRLQASTDRHDVLEQRLARWMGYPACCVFTTGYQSVLGTLSAFLDNDCTVVADNLCHASVLEGIALAKGTNPGVEIRFFKHNSVKGLRRVLSTCKGRKVLVVVEGLYGADGDVSPLDQIVQACTDNGAAIFVDDAHGIGSLGPTGRGAAEMFGVLGKIDLLMGSFSKSFGTVGGFILGQSRVIEFLKLSAKTFTFSASMPLAQTEAAMAALDIMERDLSRLDKLRKNAAFMREGLTRLGFNLADSEFHITPIMIGDETQAITFGAHLYHGAQVIMLPFVYPGVPKGKARLRCNVTAAHSESDMGFALEALAVIGRNLGELSAKTDTGVSMAKKALWLTSTKLGGARNGGFPYIGRELVEGGKKLQTLAKKRLGLAE